MTTTKTNCKQCGKPFIPKSKVNVYCDRQCQLDSIAGRRREETLRRQDTGFAWDPVRPSAVTKLKVPKQQLTNKTFYVSQGWKTAIFLPDQQFGYRRNLITGVLDPFHDPRAIEIAEQVVEAERPHLTVLLGDVNDLPTYGKYRQEPEFVGGVQPGIDRASVHISTVAELSDETVVIKGNHDIRIENHALDNALASAGLRRARRHAGEYPVLSMEYLTGTDEMKNVKWVGGYPAGAYYVNENLACIHGRVTGKNVIEKVINTERVSVVFGHVHSYQDGIFTFNQHRRPIFIRAHSPGCLCRIDGHVPSTRSGRDPFGEAVTAWENWQQGLTVCRYQPGDGRFHFEHIPIFEAQAMHRGQIFDSSKAVDDPELHLLPI